MADAMVVNDISLTHPDRVYWPGDGFTKLDLVEYYEHVATLMLPYLRGRPLTMVRCPGGLAELPTGARNGTHRVDTCFFHKHPGPDFPGPFDRVMIEESGGAAPYLIARDPGSLTALAQMGALEIHVWGSSLPDLQRPDLLVLDLDPGPLVDWTELLDGARRVREVLRGRGLESFVKATGGKGLHVVAPVTASADWRQVHDFCKAMAQEVEAQAPHQFTTAVSKAKREGKIFLDYVRNTRGSTSVAPYSTRARENAPVAYPLRWDELSQLDPPVRYTLATLPTRLARLRSDPWRDYFEVARSQTVLSGPDEGA